MREKKCFKVFFYPGNSTPIQAMNSQFLHENTAGNSVKGATQVQVEDLQSLLQLLLSVPLLCTVVQMHFHGDPAASAVFAMDLQPWPQWNGKLRDLTSTSPFKHCSAAPWLLSGEPGFIPPLFKSSLKLSDSC